METEDCNTLVSDCIVISCCCQCLILQLTVFIFIQLPSRVARKTMKYAKTKLKRRKHNKNTKKAKKHQPKSKVNQFDNPQPLSTRILEGIDAKRLHEWGSCSDEVEKVLGELSMTGEFAFGSFWGRKDGENERVCCKCCRTLTKEEVLEYGSHVLHFHLIEVVGPILGPS